MTESNKTIISGPIYLTCSGSFVVVIGAFDLSWVAPSSSRLRSILVDPLKLWVAHYLPSYLLLYIIRTCELGHLDACCPWVCQFLPLSCQYHLVCSRSRLVSPCLHPCPSPCCVCPAPGHSVISGPGSEPEHWKIVIYTLCDRDLTGVLMVLPVQSNSASST